MKTGLPLSVFGGGSIGAILVTPFEPDPSWEVCVVVIGIAAVVAVLLAIQDGVERIVSVIDRQAAVTKKVMEPVEASAPAQ